MDSPISARAALLQALVEKKGYGLDLIDRVAVATKGRVNLHQGNTYPALRSLESEGLLVSHEAEPDKVRGGRPRRYYELTARGEKEAHEDREIVSTLFSGSKPTAKSTGRRWGSK
jgi:PadR family transcriptional regulator PadR